MSGSPEQPTSERGPATGATGIIPPEFIDLPSDDIVLSREPYSKRIYRQALQESKSLQGTGIMKSPPEGTGSLVAFYLTFESLVNDYMLSGSIDPFYEAALSEGWYLGTVVDFAEHAATGVWLPCVLQSQLRSTETCVELYHYDIIVSTNPWRTFLMDDKSNDGFEIGDRVRVLKTLYNRYMYGIIIEIGDDGTGRVAFDQGGLSDIMELKLVEAVGGDAREWKWHGSTAARIDISLCGSATEPTLKDAEKKYTDWIFPANSSEDDATTLGSSEYNEDGNITNISVSRKDFVFDLEFIILNSKADITATWRTSSCTNFIQPSQQWKKAYPSSVLSNTECGGIEATSNNARNVLSRLPGRYELFSSAQGTLSYIRATGASGYTNPKEACCMMGTESLGTHCYPDYGNFVTISGLLLFNQEIYNHSISRNECSNLIKHYCSKDYKTMLGEDCSNFIDNGTDEAREDMLVMYCDTDDGKRDEGCVCVNKPLGMFDFCGACYTVDDGGYWVSDENENAFSRYQYSECEFPDTIESLNTYHEKTLGANAAFERQKNDASTHPTVIKSKDVIALALAATSVLIGAVYTLVPGPSSKRGEAKGPPLLRRMAYLIGFCTIVVICLLFSGFTMQGAQDLFGGLQSENGVVFDDETMNRLFGKAEGDTSDAEEEEGEEDEGLLLDWEPSKGDEADDDEYIEPNYCFNPAPCDQYPGFALVGDLLKEEEKAKSVPLEYQKGFDDCCLPMSGYAGREGSIPHHSDILAELGIAFGTGIILDKLLSAEMYRRFVTAYQKAAKVSKKVAKGPLQGTRKLTMKALTKMTSLPANNATAASLRAARATLRKGGGAVTGYTTATSAAQKQLQRAIRHNMMNFSRSYSRLLFPKCTKAIFSSPALRRSIGFVGRTGGRGAASALAAKAAAKLGTKVATSVAVKAGMMVGKAAVGGFVRFAGGPISALYMLLEIGSGIWDAIDDANLNTFKTNRSMLTHRDALDTKMWKQSIMMMKFNFGDQIIEKENATGTFVVFALQFMYPTEWNKTNEDLLSEAMLKAIEIKSRDPNWDEGFQAYRAQLMSDPEYNSSSSWDDQISKKATEILEQDLAWRDERMSQLLAKHIYNTNFDPAILRAARTCSWWMLARPRTKCPLHSSGVGENDCSFNAEQYSKEDIRLAMLSPRADISISGVSKVRGLTTIKISGYDTDSTPVLSSDQFKTAVVAIRIDTMDYDESKPCLPDPDVANSLLLWQTFLCLLAECPGLEFNTSTGQVCHMDEAIGPTMSCEGHEHHASEEDHIHHDKDQMDYSKTPRVTVRSIFRTKNGNRHGEKGGLGNAMWMVISPRPWHDLEYQMAGGVPPGTSRLIENYSFNSSTAGFYSGWGLSELGCEAWNQTHAAFWSNMKKVLDAEGGGSGIYSNDLLLPSSCAAIYTNNYGKPVDEDGTENACVKQYLPNKGFAALQMLGYGALISACTGDVQDTRSTVADGKKSSRERLASEALEFSDTGSGSNRVHLQPTFDYARRMCMYTDAWCRSYGMDFMLCREGEDNSHCTESFTEKACTDLNVFPDCEQTAEDKASELFFGKNLTRRVFKPIGNFLGGHSATTLGVCYDETWNAETDAPEACRSNTFGVNPWNLETKCWKQSVENEDGCNFKSCKNYDQKF